MHTPRIAIDCRFASLPGGLGHYTRAIVAELLKRADPVRYVLLVRSLSEPWLVNLEGYHSLALTTAPHYSLAEQYLLLRMLRRTGADLLFSPHFTIPILSSIPTVVTIHDLILHRFPNAAPILRRLAYHALLRGALARAQHIIAVSNTVAMDLARHYPRSAKKIVVVHEGVTTAFHPRSAAQITSTRQRYSLPRPFLLYVGNAKEHKNVPVLLEAFARMKAKNYDLILVTGGKEAQTLRLPHGVRCLTGISEDDLSSLYSAAEALLTASLDEGFCLPIVEAIACGCPVVASNRGAIPEIARGHARLIEPTVEAFANAMQNLPPRPEPERLYSWEDAAANTAAILLLASHS